MEHLFLVLSYRHDVDGLAQDCSNSSSLAVHLLVRLCLMGSMFSRFIVRSANDRESKTSGVDFIFWNWYRCPCTSYLPPAISPSYICLNIHYI